jgi:hypothetical protein
MNIEHQLTRFKCAVALSLAAIAVSGCATYKHVPEGYVGATAYIADSSEYESGSKGKLFYVSSIDGNDIQNARTATGRASYGRGFNLTTQTEGRYLKAVPVKLKLIGTHVTAAPIHEIASRAAGTFFTVEGSVEFQPVAGKRYRVVGSLEKQEASVWIIDAETNEPVIKKITAN